MKYFIDFEFLEGNVPCQIKGFNIPRWLIKPNNTIQPISVGICSSDGREYYAISKDFNFKDAWNRYDLKKSDYHRNGMEPRKDIKVYWIRDNVLKPIWEELRNKPNSKRIDFDGNSKDNYFSYNSLKYLIKRYGKTNKQIAEEIYKFVFPEFNYGGGEKYSGTINKFNNEFVKEYWVKDVYMEPEFYGYYSDYDWVVFCWLFGRMIALPTGFPMYCIDLKQTLDSKDNGYGLIPYQSNGKQFTWTKDNIKNFPGYPKQTNEHNSLADAHFNYNLYKFLQTI